MLVGLVYSITFATVSSLGSSSKRHTSIIEIFYGLLSKAYRFSRYIEKKKKKKELLEWRQILHRYHVHLGPKS
jgi:hypothetical protein